MSAPAPSRTRTPDRAPPPARIVGSISSTSINRKLVHGITRIAAERGDTDDEALELVPIPIADLPLYDYDLDDAFPPAAIELKDAIRSAAATRS